MNRYFLKVNLIGNQKFSVSTTAEGNLLFCFKSTLDTGIKSGPGLTRQVFIHVNDGLEIEAVKASEKRLKSFIIDINCWNTKRVG